MLLDLARMLRLVAVCMVVAVDVSYSVRVGRLLSWVVRVRSMVVTLLGCVMGGVDLSLRGRGGEGRGGGSGFTNTSYTLLF